jgi:ribosomal protein S12 methylthiotransferase
VGFPGETEEDYEALLNFVEEAAIDRAGCFKYENVAGAASASLPDHVDEEVKQERWEGFMALQTELAHARGDDMLGRRTTVLIDRFDEESGRFEARTKADAPEIDGVVFVRPAPQMKIGEFVEVVITDAEGHELYGEAAAF